MSGSLLDFCSTEAYRKIRQALPQNTNNYIISTLKHYNGYYEGPTCLEITWQRLRRFPIVWQEIRDPNNV